jgi:hypothetical protein
MTNSGGLAAAAAGSDSSPNPKAVSSSSTTNTNSSKKRRFEPPPVSQQQHINTAQVGDLQLLHQKSALSFFLHRQSPTSEATWYANAVTSLYVLDDAIKDPVHNTDSKKEESEDNNPTKSIKNETKPLQFALHLRGSCHVTSVEVETPSSTTVNKQELLVKKKTSFQEPRQNVMKLILSQREVLLV